MSHVAGRSNGFLCAAHTKCLDSGKKYLSGHSGTTAGTCVDQPVCKLGATYLVGFTATRGGTCAKQPACAPGELLGNPGLLRKGVCVPCSNLTCPDGE